MLFVIYLRNTGRVNLPCWPSRAARISRTLIGDHGGSSIRSGNQVMTVTDEESGGGTALNREERIKLMESDNLDAEKIAQSEPKIVFMDSSANN